MESPQTWLRELGAVRPMEAASVNALVLYDRPGGTAMISWREGHKEDVWNDLSQKWDRVRQREQWCLFGVRCDTLTREDAERVLRVVGQAVGQE